MQFHTSLPMKTKKPGSAEENLQGGEAEKECIELMNSSRHNSRFTSKYSALFVKVKFPGHAMLFSHFKTGRFLLEPMHKSCSYGNTKSPFSYDCLP